MNVLNDLERPRPRFRSNLTIALVFLGSALAGAAVGRAIESPRWRQLPLSGGPIASIAAAPSEPRVVYTSTVAAGLFRSDDGGATWASPSAAAAARGYGRVSVSPFDPRELSLTATQLFYPYFARSQDGGVTFRRITVAPGVAVRELIYDPVDPARQYVRTFSGLYRSTDAGRTWRPFAFSGARIHQLYVEPRHPERLYALVAPVNSANLYASGDGGATWTEKLSSNFLDGVTSIAVDPDRHRIYASLGVGLYLSEDDGGTWRETDEGSRLSGLTDLAVTPSGALLASSFSAIERSVDLGDTFEDSNLPEDSILGLEIGVDGTAWAVAGSGIWRSKDDGVSWRRSHRGVTAQDVQGLAASGGPEPVVLAAGRGLFRSTEAGSSWSRVRRSNDPNFFNPYFSPYFLVSSPVDSRLFFALFAYGVFRSADGGVTWEKIGPLRIFGLGSVAQLRHAFAFDPSDARKVYFFAGFAGTGDSPPRRFSFYSSDGGRTWRRRASTPELVSAAVDPRRSNVLWGATRDELLRSDDRGVRWRPVASPVRDPEIVVVDRSGALFVGTEGAGVWISRDDGASFEQLGTGLERAHIATLIADPSHPGRLFAAVLLRGVFVWDGTGRSWRPLQEGLPLGFFDGLIALDPSQSGGLYAATRGRGVFRLDLGDL